MVLAADQTTGIVARCDVAELNVTRQAAGKRGIPFSDEHGNTRDGETLDEACAQEALNGDAAVDVEMVGTAGGELRDDLLRRPLICSTTPPRAADKSIGRLLRTTTRLSPSHKATLRA